MTTNQLQFQPQDQGWWRWERILAVVLALMILSGLILFLLNANVPQTPAADPAQTSTLTTTEVGGILLRSGVGPGNTPLDILYAPTWYFDWNNRALPEITTPVLAFFVMETIHDGELPGPVPVAELRVNNVRYPALESRVVSDAPHHRVSQVLFNAVDSSGLPLITEESEYFELVVPIEGIISEGNTFRWAMPLPYGLGMLNSDQLPIPYRAALTWPVFLAIMSGVLSALSPCLLQLAVYYAAVLAGAGAAAGTAAVQVARTSLMRTSVFFVGGFTLVYTIGGFIAGYIGQSLEQLSGLESWYRPVSFVAGVIIIALAFRVAIQSRVPLVCRLPMRVNSGNGWFSSALMGFSFAIGCLSCFSATVLSALLLYAGATGSPITGALLLLMFSSGIGLIFLLAAWVMGEAAPQMTQFLQRAQPALGAVSAVVMILFGLLMITYEFHAVSGFFYQIFTGG